MNYSPKLRAPHDSRSALWGLFRVDRLVHAPRRAPHSSRIPLAARRHSASLPRRAAHSLRGVRTWFWSSGGSAIKSWVNVLGLHNGTVHCCGGLLAGRPRSLRNTDRTSQVVVVELGVRVEAVVVRTRIQGELGLLRRQQRHSQVGPGAADNAR